MDTCMSCAIRKIKTMGWGERDVVAESHRKRQVLQILLDHHLSAMVALWAVVLI